jgi:hypothetical protein
MMIGISVFLFAEDPQQDPVDTMKMVGVLVSSFMGVLAAVFAGKKIGTIFEALRGSKALDTALDRAVTDVLSNIGVPTKFGDLVGDVVVYFTNKYGLTEISGEYIDKISHQTLDKLGEIFRRLSPTQASQIVPIDTRYLITARRRKLVLDKMVSKTTVLDDTLTNPESIRIRTYPETAVKVPDDAGGAK